MFTFVPFYCKSSLFLRGIKAKSYFLGLTGRSCVLTVESLGCQIVELYNCRIVLLSNCLAVEGSNCLTVELSKRFVG